MSVHRNDDSFVHPLPGAVSRRALLARSAALVASTSGLYACGGSGATQVLDDRPLGVGVTPAPTPSPGASPPNPAPAPVAMPAWVTALPLWQWHEIPGTALSSVEPSVRLAGNTGPQSKIVAWCGASLRRRGSVYMLGAAGGHADYAGNEVNALVLNAAVPRWTQMREPSPNEVVLDGVQFYLDNRPSATHTYTATQYIDRLDRMVVVARPGLNGPFPAPPAGYPYTGNTGRSFSFGYAASDWDHPDHIARFPGRGDAIACLCCKHPYTDDVYYSRNYGDGWYRWASAYNRWDKLSNVSRGPWYVGSAIDPVRNRMLIVGGYSDKPPEVRDLSGNELAVSFRGLGAAALTMSNYPGVVYDEVNDNFVVAFNSGGQLRLLLVKAADFTVSSPVLSGPTPAARPNGIHNAVQYVPELRGLAVANSYDGNVLFMRTA